MRRVFEAKDITITKTQESKITKSGVERIVKEELVSSKVGINNALAIDKYYGFYDFSCEPNMAFIRYILVML